MIACRKERRLFGSEKDSLWKTMQLTFAALVLAETPQMDYVYAETIRISKWGRAGTKLRKLLEVAFLTI